MAKLYPLVSNQAILNTVFNVISLAEALPKRPYCSDNLRTGIYPRLQRIAITKRYIQLNPPSMQYWLVFDIDRPHSAYAWNDTHLPPPFAVVVNQQNSHCHIIYALETPVCTSDLAHEKPLRYLAAIQQAYTEKLQADINYSGLIAKNPFSEHWHVFPVALNVRYSLDELADYVDLTKAYKRPVEASSVAALGRNCFLFDTVRLFAYDSIRKYRTGSVEAWRNVILDYTMASNTFTEPLQHGEVKGIAKSVANWVWKHMRHDTEAFKQRQSVRGKKGNAVSIKARQSKTNNKRVAATVLKEQGLPLTEIARTLGLTDRTIRRWKL